MKKRKDKEKKVVQEKKPRDLKATNKVLRVIVLLTVVFVLFRGLTSIFNNDRILLNQLSEEVKYLKEHPPEEMEKSPIISGAAKNYLREYLTYTGNQDERERRLKYLTIARLNEEMNPDVISVNPTGIEVYKLEKINEKEVNVNLQAVTNVKRYGKENSDTGEREILNEQLSGYYRLTVVLLDDGVIVKNVPIRIPDLGNTDNYKPRIVNYTAPDKYEKKEIEESLKSFFKAYVEGTAKDISYVTTIEDLKGLSGLCKFMSMEKADIRLNDQNEAFCNVIVKLSDSLKTYRGYYQVKLVKIEGQYMVESLDITNADFEKHYFEEEKE